MNFKKAFISITLCLIYIVYLSSISIASTKSSMDQVIIVVGTGGYRANVSLYEKVIIVFG